MTERIRVLMGEDVLEFLSRVQRVGFMLWVL